MRVTVLGAGAWGTSLALVAHQGGHQVRVWGHQPEHLLELPRTGRNDRYLPGIPLPSTWQFEPDLDRAIPESDCIIVAVPSQGFRSVSQHLASFRGVLVSVTKGIEKATGLTMCGILRSLAPHAPAVALSGPTFALEVARGIPTAIVAASQEVSAAQTVQQLLHRPTFRVYSSSDPLGVELGGALKNVVAIAAGVGDGLGFGDNSKAALITRGIVEITRLGVAAGAQSATFAGLSGLGDLTATCYSRLSRNRSFGERLGRGEPLKTILTDTTKLAEGYPTAQSAYELAKLLKVETPIIDEVHAMIYGGKDPAQAVQDLTRRETKAEN